MLVMQIDNSWEMQSSGEIESAACTFRVLREYMVATAGVCVWESLPNSCKKS